MSILACAATRRAAARIYGERGPKRCCLDRRRLAQRLATQMQILCPLMIPAASRLVELAACKALAH